jgi:DNA-directed RNA polymerase subunit RPC12/RpoP
MFIKTEYVITEHTRPSKLGHDHTYRRKKSVLVFRCDSCGETFTRDKGSMSPERVSNNFYHVCSNCNAKKFAQEKGVERRKIWDMPVSSLKNIGHL